MRKAAVASVLGLLVVIGCTNANAQEKKLPVAGITNKLVEILNSPQTETNSLEVVASEPKYVSYDVPTNNAFKSYMDAKWITSKSSDQYKLKSKYELSTCGIYCVEGNYCVAVGSYYSTKIGTKIDIVMESGEIVSCILADCKDDKDTDSTNRQNRNSSIVEFIVSEKWLNAEAKKMGDCSYALPEMEGEIKELRIYE